MTILIPNAQIAARWSGALQARLRQAPLERFLRARGKRWVSSGESRVSDNLANCTIALLEPNVVTAPGGGIGLYPLQQPAIAQAACAISHAVAGLIEDSSAARIAALVSAARLLTPAVGLAVAAPLAAAAARDYTADLHVGAVDPALEDIVGAALTAVRSCKACDADRLSALMAARLASRAQARMPLALRPAAGESGTL